MLTLYGLGTIIGAGIYVLVGEIAGHAGVFAPVAFLVAAVVAAFTGFTYGELAARLPFSAGEAVYVNNSVSTQMVIRDDRLGCGANRRGFCGSAG